MSSDNREYYLGIDTSNYKTSMAIVDDEGNILRNVQKLLDVEKGKRGLRQSEALFQHVNNLPKICELTFADIDDKIVRNIRAISVSTAPRPVEGSYMPVFNGGASLGESLSHVLHIPCYRFSHQEGHIEAARHYSPLNNSSKFVCFHFSGGTTEAILVQWENDTTTYEIVGGTKDISFGQLLDRIGVSLSMEFPCGAEMDEIAIDCKADMIALPKIKSNSGYINLSGIETKCQSLIGDVEKDSLICSVFRDITTAIEEMTLQISKKCNVYDFLYAGGVSSSSYIRRNLSLPDGVNCYFADVMLSGDNAVGTALLGGKRYAAETH